MSRRSKMPHVMVGDVGEITIRPERKTIAENVDLDSMDLHELCALAIDCGIGLKELIGIDNCFEHVNMIFLGANDMPEGFNIIEHVKYCKNCFQMFRLKRI